MAKRKMFYIFVLIFLISASSFADNKNTGDTLIAKLRSEMYKNPRNAIIKATTIIPEYEKKNNLHALAELNRIIGTANDNLSNYNIAKEYYTKSLRIYYQINDIINVANLYNDIGICNLTQSRYSDAQDFFTKALIIFNQNKIYKEIPVVLANIALCYQYTYDYKNAVKYLIEAIKLTEKNGDKEALATQFNNLAIIYKTLRNFDEALIYYQKSYKIFNELNDFPTTSLILNNIGNIYYHQKKYDKAIENYNSSLKFKEKTGNRCGVANTLNNIGEVYQDKGNLKEALNYYNKSLKIMEEIENYSGVIYTTNSIGKTYYEQKDYDRAELYFLRSVELGKIHNTPVKLAHYYLSEIYHKKNNFTKSLVHLQAYSELQDSLFGSAKIQEINDILAGYKISQKDMEIGALKESNLQKDEQLKERLVFVIILAVMLILLVIFIFTIKKNLRRTKKIRNELDHINTIQQETNAKLEDAMDELRHEIGVRQLAEAELNNTKDKLSSALIAEKEIHELKTRFISMVSHEYRNPLTMILNTTELLNFYYKQNDSASHDHQIKNIRKAVDSMVKLLNDVLLIGKAGSQIYEMEIGDIKVAEFFNNVITNVKAIDKNKHDFLIKIASEVDFIRSDPYHLTHVITNLLSNAAKYSPDSSVIDINIYTEKDRLVIKVTDKGIGIPEEDKKFLFQPFYRSTNTGSISGTGLGLTIVKMYVDLLRGHISFESEESIGTIFTLTLPFDYNK